nr:retrotransposon protein, putative, unclassified [Tanacetum cinerariifolium]
MFKAWCWCKKAWSVRLIGRKLLGVIEGDGPKWLFNIDTLTESINYVPDIAGTHSNDFAGKGASFDAGQSSMETGPNQDYILMSLWNDGSLFDSSRKDSDGDNQDNAGPSTESEIDNQERPNDANSTKDINNVRPSINIASLHINTASLIVNTVRLSDDFFVADNDMRSLDEVELDISNISTTYPILTTLNTKINKDHSLDNVIGDILSGVQTRRMTVTTDEQGFISAIYEKKTREDLHTCLFTYFLSQEEPKRITNMDVKSAFIYGRIKEEVYACQPLGFEDPDYPDKVYKVEKALYGLRQAPRAWYETLAKSTKKELCTEFEELMHHKFQMSLMGELNFFLGLQVKRKSDGIFISHDKYVDEILRNFKYEDVKPAITPIDKEKALLKDSDGVDVDVHLYRSMIRSLMYLTSSRPDIMFSCKKQTMVATFTIEAEYVVAASCCGQETRTRTGIIDIRIPQSNVPSGIADEAITKEMYDRVRKATTTVSTLENKAIITLTKRVKKIEKKLKHKRKRAVIDSSEVEEPSLDHEDSHKQRMIIEEIDKDKNVNLVKSSEQGEAHETADHRMYFSTDDVQAHIQADEDLAQRMLKEERESLSIKERSRLLVEFIDKRKKMLAVKRAEEKRNKPPTQAQQRTYISNYLKNIGGYTLKQLKQNSFEEIKMLFDNTMESIRRLVPMKSKGQAAYSKAGEGSSKAGESLKRYAKEELGQEQKVEEEIAQQEDVIAKQAKKESSKKA